MFAKKSANQRISNLANAGLIFVRWNAESRGAKSFSVIGRSEGAIINDDELIESEENGIRRIRDEEWIDKDRESVVRVVAFCLRMGAFAGQKCTGVEENFARISHHPAIAEDF